MPVLRDRVRSIEYITTATADKAALLEDKLVKEHKPRYNFDLKDDKRFLSVKVTMQEQFPRILLCHQRVEDGSLERGVRSGLEAPAVLGELGPPVVDGSDPKERGPMTLASGFEYTSAVGAKSMLMPSAASSLPR